jgi:hypothetical protein
VVAMCSDSKEIGSLNDRLAKLNIKLSKPLKSNKRTNNHIFPKDMREIGIQKLALVKHSDLWEKLQKFQNDETENSIDSILYGWALNEHASLKLGF